MGFTVLAAILSLGLTACGANLYRSAAEDPQAKEVPAAELTATRVNSNDFQRLKQLWEKRSDHGAVQDFPIGDRFPVSGRSRCPRFDRNC